MRVARSNAMLLRFMAVIARATPQHATRLTLGPLRAELPAGVTLSQPDRELFASLMRHELVCVVQPYYRLNVDPPPGDFHTFHYARWRVILLLKKSLTPATVAGALRWERIALAARNRIIVTHKAFAHHMARRLNADAADAIVGMIRAVERCDVSRGAKFLTYAGLHVRSQIGRTRVKKRRALITNIGRDEEGEDCLSATVVARDDQVGTLELNELRRIIRTNAARLTDPERVVIGHALRGSTQTDAANELGVSREWARQLYTTALSKLRLALSNPLGDATDIAILELIRGGTATRHSLRRAGICEALEMNARIDRLVKCRAVKSTTRGLRLR